MFKVGPRAERVIVSMKRTFLSCILVKIQTPVLWAEVAYSTSDRRQILYHLIHLTILRAQFSLYAHIRVALPNSFIL